MTIHFDRDNTLFDASLSYNWMPGAEEALKLCRDNDVHVRIVTNKPTSLFTKEETEDETKSTVDKIKEIIPGFDRSEDYWTFKSVMLQKQNWHDNEIEGYMIGDSLPDMAFARLNGIAGIRVNYQGPYDVCASDILDATKYAILDNGSHGFGVTNEREVDCDVLLTGTFDILHPGHIKTLRDFGSLDNAVVAVNSDESVYTYKGKYPVHTQLVRAFQVAEVAKCPVILMHEPNPIDIIDRLRPTQYALSTEYKGTQYPEQNILRHLGCKMIWMPRISDFSSSSLRNNV